MTNTASDRYVFRAPELGNVAIAQPYFHSGKVWKLQDAEVMSIAAFLRTLSGRQPRIEHPLLPPGTDATPRPSLAVKPLETK